MRFADPQLLWLLALLPLLVVGIALRYGWRRRVLARLGHLPQVNQLVADISHGRRLVKNILLVGGLGLLIFALARPQAGERTTLAPYVGIDVVVALDFSKSMLAPDTSGLSRIDRAKAELNELLDSLRGDRVGLVAFAGATMSYPLTTDYSAAKLFWRDMQPNDMPVGGTAIGRAITAAVRLLKGVRGKGPPRGQVILLLTDGEDHESDPIKAAKEAAKLGIRIYTVGIGSSSGEPVPLVAADGTITGYMQKDGKPVTSRLDAKMLDKIAELTAAKFFRVGDKAFSAAPLRDELEKLQRSEIESRLVKHYDEVYHWFLFPGLMLLLFELCLGDRRRLKGGRR